MHYLAKLLNDLGHEVTMSTCVQNPEWPSYAYPDRQVEADLFVVPEILTVDLHNCCRWVLNKPGILAGPQSYGDNERVWYFCDDLKASAESATNHPVKKLFLPSVDPKILPKIAVKDKRAFFVGKYKGPPQNHHPDAIAITHAFPHTRKKTYELLAQCKELYCYDQFTFIACEAMYFGTHVYTWNGQQWIDYVPQWNFEDYIMDHARDLMTVSRFVNEACETFNL